MKHIGYWEFDNMLIKLNENERFLFGRMIYIKAIGELQNKKLTIKKLHEKIAQRRVHVETTVRNLEHKGIISSTKDIDGKTKLLQLSSKGLKAFQFLQELEQFSTNPLNDDGINDIIEIIGFFHDYKREQTRLSQIKKLHKLIFKSNDFTNINEENKDYYEFEGFIKDYLEKIHTYSESQNILFIQILSHMYQFGYSNMKHLDHLSKYLDILKKIDFKKHTNELQYIFRIYIYIVNNDQDNINYLENILKQLKDVNQVISSHFLSNNKVLIYRLLPLVKEQIMSHFEEKSDIFKSQPFIEQFENYLYTGSD